MLQTEINGAVASIVLDRPEVHNAFNDELVSRITTAFEELGSRADVRVIVLRGNGISFCAGADLNWMRRSIGQSFEQARSVAVEISRMLQTIAACPKPVIARIHGAALAGGAGLVAAVDIALAVRSAIFGFTEVRIGLVPGVVSPFVLARIGTGRAREYFLTAERFPADTAHEIGLVNDVLPDVEGLDKAMDSKIEQILSAAPGAIAATKSLIAEVSRLEADRGIDYAEKALAKARSSDEGQAGMKAFLEGRKPPWARP